jgi:tRNA1Val (adenine37-N6)-methyltransferase
MGRNNYFQFKRFLIIQEKSAMKVGTDGVLLGSWINVSGAGTILDIGTGTGIIALILAQRSTAEITAIEIEKNAAEEAADNFNNSDWRHRLHLQNISLQDLVKKNDHHYDLIVANPPFFNKTQKSKCQCLAIAKHNDLLPFPVLAGGAARLLSVPGRLAIILPADAATEFIDIAKKEGLSLSRLTEVRPKTSKKIHRMMMEFTNIETRLQKSSLIIHDEDGKDYSNKYKWITKEFYLNF